jgi:hypothetical protein
MADKFSRELYFLNYFWTWTDFRFANHRSTPNFCCARCCFLSQMQQYTKAFFIFAKILKFLFLLKAKKINYNVCFPVLAFYLIKLNKELKNLSYYIISEMKNIKRLFKSLSVKVLAYFILQILVNFISNTLLLLYF